MKVLIVEDNIDHQIVFRKILEDHYRDIDVNLVDSIGLAKIKLEKDRFDILLLDYRLGDGNGIELIEWIRNRGIESPIIMITSMEDVELAVKAIKVGAYDYICKTEESFNRLPVLINKVIEEYEVRDKLQKTEFKYKTLIEGMREAVFLMNDKGELLYISGSIKGLTGYDEGFFKKNLFSLLTGKSKRIFYNSLTNIARGQNVEPFIIRFYKKDGDMVYLEINASSFDYNESNIGVIGTIQDVTRRVLLEKEVEQERSKIGSILNSMVDQVYLVDERFNLIFANKTLMKKVGNIKKGDKCYKILYNRDSPCPFCKWNEVKKGFTVRWELRNKAGETYDVISTPLKNPKGGLLSLVILRNISKRKKIEEELREEREKLKTSNEKLKETIKHLQDTREQLIQTAKLASLGKLISGVAHEINNPLFSAMGYSELLLMDNYGDEDQKEKLLNVIQSIKRAKKVVEDLLKFSRKKGLEKEIINVNDVIIATVALRRYSLKVNSIDIEMKLEDDVPPIMGNFNQLQQVFLNIIINAEQAMEEIIEGYKKRVIIVSSSYDRNSEFVAVSISNNGPMIPQNIIDKIFDPFFTTKEVGKGTGLGLSTSYGIIKDHDGEIEISSDPEITKFTISLPVYKTIHRGEEEYRVDEEGERTKSLNGQNEKILVIDDERVITNLLRDFLSQRNYQVYSASSGEEAIEILESMDVSIIITDVKMPGMDGIEFYQELKERKPHLLNRLIFITGDTVGSATNKFLKNTGNLYLKKPFSFEEITKAISSISSKT